MKNKIISFCILLLIFTGYFSMHFIHKKPCKRKILKVVEADKFYVDFNSNNKIDSDELVKLKDIIAITPVKNPYTTNIANTLNMDIIDYMKVGYIARDWAKTKYEGKYIDVIEDSYTYSKYSKYRIIKAEIDNIDPAKELLENGFAVLYPQKETYNYILKFNPKLIKNNLKQTDKLKFYFYNTYSGKLHKSDCIHVKDIKYGELFLKPDEYKNFLKCKSCFNLNKQDKFNKIELKSLKSYKKSQYKKFDDIEIYLINPIEYSYPNNKTDISKRLIKEINNSKTSIDIAIYGFGTQDEIFSALKSAKERGVKIRAVLDYSKKMEEIYSNTLLFSKTFDSKLDKTETLMHNKFFIFDDKKVITGSANVSSSGTGGYNANTVLIIDSEKIAKYYKDEFNQMYSGKFQKNKKKYEKPTVNINNSEVSIYFSPVDDIYNNAIFPLIKNAKSEIYVSVFYLTHKSLVKKLINAKSRGVNVVIIIDSLGAFQFKNLIYELRAHNIPVKAENWGGKNHEKTIMVDSEFLLTGSSNFSGSGFNYNDENMVLIKNPEIAKFWKDYFLFLFNTIDNKFLNRIPRAESFESKNSCYDGIDNNFDGKIDLEDDGCKK